MYRSEAARGYRGSDSVSCSGSDIIRLRQRVTQKQTSTVASRATTGLPKTSSAIRVPSDSMVTNPAGGQAGSRDSMAATSSSDSGSVRGRKRVTSPSGESRNFSKFHCTSPASPAASAVRVSSA